MHGNYLLYWDFKKNEMGINEGPNGMQKIDSLIAEAKKRNLKLIITFPNCAGWLVWRLVSHQQDGKYPLDGHPNAQFDVRKDEIALWNLLREATNRGRVNNRVDQPLD